MKKRIFAIVAILTLVFSAVGVAGATSNTGGQVGTFELPSTH